MTFEFASLYLGLMRILLSSLLLFFLPKMQSFGQTNSTVIDSLAKPVSSALDGPLKDSLRDPDFVKRNGIILPAGFDTGNKQWVSQEEFNALPPDRKHLFRVKPENHSAK